ncbi:MULTISPECIES: PAS domain-containing protein [unclassified Microbacterium]|uniref:PAS domain-containing protein n=1 Tax=unclassified Microbacterium TaxID=2609290 RepID=UPI001604F81F|nr:MULTISPECIES: PAS domain-containing protein [unclassified Microbacterium]QNA93385.1 PAS domain-containing protein [Microbacterium sp. Se63.02b]QYM63612.1 PAS domain-containing protein [Microbacterium sp. Se5.02b]
MASKMTLRVQLLVLQALIVFLVTLATGIVAGAFQEQALREAYKDRMQAVAQSIAALPAVQSAFDDADPAAAIQPIAEVIREASDLAYVVVANEDGIRYSHPNPARIGEKVSTDPSIPLSGEIYVGTQTGTLGTSWRVKVPIRDDEGTVIGTASVGILESELNEEFSANLVWLISAMLAAAVLGVFGSAWVTSVIRRRIYRLEPHQIAALVKNQETTLHGLSEGVITVDDRGRITLVNDAAARFLGTDAADLDGASAAEVLGEELATVLREGEAAGRPVIVGSHVLVARSTGSEAEDGGVGATLLLRDHTELHDVVRRVEAADAIIAFRQRFGIPKGLSAETLERVSSALAARTDATATEIGDDLDISRVSARRYLEHLASSGRATRSLDYTTKGRPSTRYGSIDAV